MLPHVGGAADDMTRGGGGVERAVRGMLEADDLTRGGGGCREASGHRTNGRHNKRVGAHDVVGGGDVGSDSSNGSWSSEIGGGTLLMPGTVAPVTVPAPRGVDDADDAPMAVGGGRGGGERGAKTAEQPPIGRGG